MICVQVEGLAQHQLGALRPLGGRGVVPARVAERAAENRIAVLAQFQRGIGQWRKALVDGCRSGGRGVVPERQVELARGGLHDSDRRLRDFGADAVAFEYEQMNRTLRGAHENLIFDAAT
jgi:hypothetical protein